MYFRPFPGLAGTIIASLMVDSPRHPVLIGFDPASFSPAFRTPRFIGGGSRRIKRSKYMPHQGEQECARRRGGAKAKHAVRVRQMGL